MIVHDFQGPYILLGSNMSLENWWSEDKFHLKRWPIFRCCVQDLRNPHSKSSQPIRSLRRLRQRGPIESWMNHARMTPKARPTEPETSKTSNGFDSRWRITAIQEAADVLEVVSKSRGRQQQQQQQSDRVGWFYNTLLPGVWLIVYDWYVDIHLYGEVHGMGPWFQPCIGPS